MLGRDTRVHRKTSTRHLHHRLILEPVPPHMINHSPRNCTSRATLSTRLLEGLAEHEKLGLVVDGEYTSTGDTTEDISTSTLEERSHTLLGDDLSSGVEGGLVLDGLSECDQLGTFGETTEEGRFPSRETK